MDRQELIFHGSNTSIPNGEFLMPMVSFDYEPLVYATDDIAYALVRCGKFDISDIAIKEDYQGADKKYTLVELYPGAFEKVFSTEGYLYFVNAKDFEKRDNEYVSRKPVQIVSRFCIPNVWLHMLTPAINEAYRLVRYRDSVEYLKSIGCDLDKYLERRRERVRKILELKQNEGSADQ